MIRNIDKSRKRLQSLPKSFYRALRLRPGSCFNIRICPVHQPRDLPREMRLTLDAALRNPNAPSTTDTDTPPNTLNLKPPVQN